MINLFTTSATRTFNAGQVPGLGVLLPEARPDSPLHVLQRGAAEPDQLAGHLQLGHGTG